jgi:hypothetical protein
VDRTGSGSCPLACFLNSCVESFCFAARELVLSVRQISFTPVGIEIVSVFSMFSCASYIRPPFVDLQVV